MEHVSFSASRYILLILFYFQFYITNSTHTHTHSRLTAFFPGLPG